MLGLTAVTGEKCDILFNKKVGMTTGKKSPVKARRRRKI